jgi:hypothetical protein
MGVEPTGRMQIPGGVACGWRGCTPKARLRLLTGSSCSESGLQPE